MTSLQAKGTKFTSLKKEVDLIPLACEDGGMGVWVQTSFSVHFIVVVIGDNNKARFHCQE